MFWCGAKFPVWEKWFYGIPGVPGKAKKARRVPGRVFGASGEGGLSAGRRQGISSKRPAGPSPFWNSGNTHTRPFGVGGGGEGMLTNVDG